MESYPVEVLDPAYRCGDECCAAAGHPGAGAMAVGRLQRCMQLHRRILLLQLVLRPHTISSLEQGVQPVDRYKQQRCVVIGST
jgi:hypothetical protein